jgi:hypothetical protein
MSHFSKVAVLLGAVLVFANTPSLRAGEGGYRTLEPNSIEMVKLSDLITGVYDGLVVGDKMFDHFLYSATGDMPPAELVNVLGIQRDGHLGIRFQGAFFDAPETDPQAPTQLSSDAGITFEVAINPEFVAKGWIITDAHLFGSGTNTNGEFTDGEGSFIAVDESFTGNTPVIAGTMQVFDSRIGRGGRKLEDSIVFDQGYTRLRVQKDIVARASKDAILPSRMTIIDQTFSQTQIPEPVTAGLLGAALCCVLVRRRK